MSDFIFKLVIDHFLAIPAVAGLIALILLKIDKIILFALRFFDKETLKKEIDKLEDLAQARIDKVAKEKEQQDSQGPKL